jgi:hypothetical protein
VTLPLDPFNRVRLPVAFDRRERVRLIREVAEALLRGELPERAAALFVGGALSAWLSKGGRLENSYFQVSARRGSHATPAALAAELDAHRDEGQDSDL